ncbi:copper resistance protein CopC [Streptomyces capparidis]
MRQRLRPRRGAARAAALVLAAVLALLLGGAGQASAHSKLVSTSPAADSVLRAAPRHVTLTFTEGMTLLDDSVRVFAPDGGRVRAGEPERVGGDRATARVDLPPGLGRGTFTVAWKVVSADSHPVSGAFVFSVGEVSATRAEVPGQEPGGGAAGALYGAARFLAYAGFAVLVGTAGFWLLCLRGGPPPRSLRRQAAAGCAALLAATAGQLLLRAPYESGDGLGAAVDPSALERTLGSGPGQALTARLALTALAGAYLLAARALPRRAALGAGAVLAAALACTWALAEHASTGPQVAVAVPADVAHLLAAATWLGGLAALLVVLFREPGDAGRAVERFSRVAFAAVVTLVVTGVYQSWRQLGSLAALTGTSYGGLLTAKLCAVAALLVAASCSRRWVAARRSGGPAAAGGGEAPAAGGGEAGDGGPAGGGPAPGRTALLTPVRTGGAAAPGRAALRRSVLAEAAVAVLVLSVTTALTGTEPGRSAQRAAADAPALPAAPGSAYVAVPFDTGSPAGKGQVLVNLEPGTTGTNDLNALAYAADGGIAAVPDMRIRFTLPARDVGPLEVPLKNVGGYFTARDFQLPMAGVWTVSVTVRTGDVEQDTGTGRITVG